MILDWGTPLNDSCPEDKKKEKKITLKDSVCLILSAVLCLSHSEFE